MLVRVLTGLAVVLVVFLAVVATRPAAYHIERKIEVAAPPEIVFPVVNDLHQFSDLVVFFGTPLVQSDPNMQKTYDGPASGVGQSFAWSGNKDAGKGKLTIEESVLVEKVGVKLEFVEPMKSTADCALTLAGTEAGTSVTWSMDGKHNFLGKAMSLFMNMDQMLGADLEKGLARLKTAAEGEPLL